MAADQTFSWNHGKPQESVPLQDFNITEGQDCNAETWHVTFRAFTGSEESDPVEDLRRLQELCRLWLRPDVHTKDQILDKLVIEQFMVSMPQELQVLVKESGVNSCKDLEDILRSNAKPKKWTIVSLQGQKFLLRDSDVVMAEAEVSDTDDVTDLSRKPPSSVSRTEIYPENSQKVLQKLEDVPGIDEMSRGQVWGVLPETVPEKGELEGLRPTQNLEEDPMEDREETMTSPEPQPPKCPEDSVRAEGGKNPQEATRIKNVDANVPHTHVRKEAMRQTPYECGTCKKRFNYESQLTVHQRTHTGDRPFKCMVCHKGFMQSSDLRVHQRVHTGEKPYTCKICFKQFTHDSTLRSHQRVHTNEKPYQCEVCDKHFNHKGNLNVHLRTHSGAKPYVCHQCHQDFRQLGTLKRHQKTHLKVITQKFCHQAQVPSTQEGN
ncbi:zinc finger and SCAN domain-containing protein 5B [Rousettus aegyptiacus]|uniref:zinc finger and SCAN domain-containing protein 5B n=1 Tax=Rousettus aegyptiacus TaxID=9407 RepID=UPI00168CBE0C|nr:zinc finger and SCAN domain-containing protein 5B [Rousettus aegyptiacus]